MHTKVKTRDGSDAIIIDMNGPDPDWPIAAWVHTGGGWYTGHFRSSGRCSEIDEYGSDLMLTIYKYRTEFKDRKTSPWHYGMSFDPIGHKISRGTFNMDGELIDLCLLTKEQVAELRAAA